MLNFIKKLAVDAGRICLEGAENLTASDVEFKNPRDLVTVVDIRVEMNLNIYDIAAGVLLVTEAGGTVCDFKGGAAYPESGIIATNGTITAELMQFFNS